MLQILVSDEAQVLISTREEGFYVWRCNRLREFQSYPFLCCILGLRGGNDDKSQLRYGYGDSHEIVWREDRCQGLRLKLLQFVASCGGLSRRGGVYQPCGMMVEI